VELKLRSKCDSTGRYERLESGCKNQDSRYKKPFDFRMAFLVYTICYSGRGEESSAICIALVHRRLLFFDIAALSVTFFLTAKKIVTKEKLSAAF